jgi:curved DNA-binding protein CbpA
MGNKKTLYEVLNVSPNASTEQIQAAYKNVVQRLESGFSGLSAADAVSQIKVVNIAFQVLRDQMSRGVYDAKLNQQTALALVPRSADTEALTLKMDATVLKADAAALLAQAAMANANALALNYGVTPQGLGGQARSSFFKTFRFGFTVLGAIVAISMVVMVVSGGRGSNLALEIKAHEKAQEKVMLQEYYQQHGVRPSSKAEMDLLEIKRRKEEAETRTADRMADKKTRDAERFKEENERLGRQVSENLQRAEEYARQLEREEDYKKQRELEKIQYEKTQRAEAEQNRLREERRKLGLN